MFRSLSRVIRFVPVSARIATEQAMNRNPVVVEYSRCCAVQNVELRRANSTAAPSQNVDSTKPKDENQDNNNTEDQISVEEALKQIAQFKEDAAKSGIALKEMKDKYMRTLAEVENVRTRLNKKVEDTKLMAIDGFCKDLLEVSDILDKAVTSLPQQTLNDPNCPTELTNLHQGMVMTKTVLHKTFGRHGLVPIDPSGEKFDPNFHEAVFQVPVSEAGKLQPGYVAHVATIGYLLHEKRLIRAAQVGVVSQS